MSPPPSVKHPPPRNNARPAKTTGIREASAPPPRRPFAADGDGGRIRGLRAAGVGR